MLYSHINDAEPQNSAVSVTAVSALEMLKPHWPQSSHLSSIINTPFFYTPMVAN